MHGGTGMEVHLKSKNHIKRFQSQFVGSLFGYSWMQVDQLFMIF